MLWEELLEARCGVRKVIHRRSGAGASRRPSAQEACATDLGCAHRKLNSELLVHHKSRAAGSFPREAGATLQGHLRPHCPVSAEPAEGGAPSVRYWDPTRTFIYKPYPLLILKCTHRREKSASITHQKAERLELPWFLKAGEGRPDFGRRACLDLFFS